MPGLTVDDEEQEQIAQQQAQDTELETAEDDEDDGLGEPEEEKSPPVKKPASQRLNTVLDTAASMLVAFKIESNIPLPAPHNDTKSKKVNPFYLALSQMEEGDSFFLPGMTPTQQKNIRTIALANKIKIAQRKRFEHGVEGVRTWRVVVAAKSPEGDGL